MSERILFVVDNLPRARFFARFASVCQERGIPFRFLAYRWSSQKYLRKIGHNTTILLQRGSERSTLSSAVLAEECERSLEVISGDVNLPSLIRRVSAIAGQIDVAIDSFSPTHVFLWNGSQLIDRLATRLCAPGIERRYFEISNLPGKMFVDPQGVNAASSLYENPETLLATGVPSDEEFETWRSGYLHSQASRGVPQAKVAQSFQWERPADALASRLGFGSYPIGIRPMLSRFVGKVTQNSFVKELIEEYGLPVPAQGSYRFFPLQVSGDTQLLLNSNVGNIEALRRVFAKCLADRIDLVIKIHPAENDRTALAQLRSVLQEARQRGRIYLSSQPTTELIQGAERVYTINSTVGLETLIAGKPLEVLGRALYQHFIGREDLLKCYLLRYLIPFDYFASDQVSSELMQRVVDGWVKTVDASDQLVCET